MSHEHESNAIDSIARAYTDGAARLAELLRLRASLKADLELAAGKAAQAGLLEFEVVLRDLATQAGAIGVSTPQSNAKRRRGRPPKPVATEVQA